MPRDHLNNVQSPLDFQVLGIRTRQLSSWQPYRGPPARNQVARNFHVTFRVLASGLKASNRKGKVVTPEPTLDSAAVVMMSTAAQSSLRVIQTFGSHRIARRSAPRCTHPSTRKGCRARCRGEGEAADAATSLLPFLAALPAVSAFAANAMDSVDTLSTTTTYVPSAMDSGDGWAQFVVLMVTAVCGLVGMKVSFDGEQAASQDAIMERVAKQVAAMQAADTVPVAGVPVGEVKDLSAASGAASSLDTDGLLRVDGVLSPVTAAALLDEVNATLDRELSRAGKDSLPSDSFGNVYCKGNRYDLKLPLRGVAEAALREAALNLGPVLEKVAGGNNAKLCEFAALVSDPGSMRQPVHPDTNYRRDRCVVTTFVALQDVESDMGPTVFIPGSHTASAHLAFKEADEVGGPALTAPNCVATLRTGDVSMFDSRLLHCGGGNSSDKRRVLFYFSFEVSGTENPNAFLSSIRDELRGTLTLKDLRTQPILETVS